MAVVLITGVAGLIGGVLRRGLQDKYAVRGLDRRPDGDPGVRQADVTRPRTLAGAFDGVDAIIDLASGASVDLGWDDVHRDCRGRINVLEAASAHGVGRYIFASSNRVTGMYELEDPYAAIVAGSYGTLDPYATPLVGPTSPLRPDGPYAVGKALGETASRFYADRYGISCICLRIGTVNPINRPACSRDFATLLTYRDLIQLVDCALRAPPELHYGVYYGVSANTWRFWDIANAKEEIGFEPQDNAEQFRLRAGAETV